MFSRHTAENMFGLISRFLDILCPSWHTKLIGLGSDGANVMTGEYNGVLTKLEQQVQHKVYRTWCTLHQLDLVMKYGYDGLMNGDFIKISNKFIAHLHDQDKLIQDMGSTCPKLSNRWIVMGNVCEWLIEHRREISLHIAEVSAKETNKKAKETEKNTDETKMNIEESVIPPNSWWVVVAAVGAITHLVNITFIKLQGRDMLVSQQVEELGDLAVLICTQIGVEGPLEPDKMASLDSDSYSTHGRWAVSDDAIFDFLHDEGSYIRNILESLDAGIRYTIVGEIGKLVVHIIDEKSLSTVAVFANTDAISPTKIFENIKPAFYNPPSNIESGVLVAVVYRGFEERLRMISNEKFLMLTFYFIDRYRLPKLFEMRAMPRDNINEISSCYFDKLIREDRRKVFACTIFTITLSLNIQNTMLEA